jgi:reverse transcriptase-like protein
VNSIASHLPWASVVLAPFYALSAKQRLTKQDITDLKPYWVSLKRLLTDVKSLYEPRPGDPLTLRVDAAEAGVGAVLLYDPTGEDKDTHIVAMWCKAFDGQQGRRHPGFREAWGLLRAVKHFYPYLDGCANLWIKTDATTALSLFNHKDTCQADELGGFRAELSAMGVHSDMMHH